MVCIEKEKKSEITQKKKAKRKIKVEKKSNVRLSFSLDGDEISGNSVSPPELTRNTPITNVLQPAIPSFPLK